ncbi:integrin beta-PS-like isoform X1 [Planococcus citri]|uniref:integrin beta-PS-like isoform X1 n=1 Tax=Planococcus citri TaxID=170843 RepID=UPI0031F79DA3
MLKMKKLTSFVLQICLACFLTQWTLAQQSPKVANWNCASKGRCDECIRTYGCEWCSDPALKDRRCSKIGESAKCSANYIINPIIETVANVSRPLSEVIKGDGSSSVTSSSSQGSIVQVMPQLISINLRPNEGNPYRFKVWYRQATDYPVDLYYLMDLSNSMKDDKDKLSALGSELAETMTKITGNFRLGFGSFVDKVVMPYVSIVPKRLLQPCDDDRDSECVAPYGFRNHMSLSSSPDFAEQVKSANVSGNLDAPEGGFDAIMQAIVCREQIGWRNQARKLLVFSTDSSFHYAGDGKLGGIIKPNDGCCHLDNSGLYTHSTVQDYPSVSQINAKVKENSINVIFAVTADQIELYKQLGNHIEGSSAGELSSDSSNVVRLVVDQYNKITSKVQLKEKNLGNDFRIKYFTKCLNSNGALMETNECSGFKVGQTIEFDVELELLRCPEGKTEYTRQFQIYPVGIEDGMTVEVHMICDCNCQNPGHPSYQENSPKCSGNGVLKCGVCECYPGFSGDDCSCTSGADKTDKCHPVNSTQLCSGRGVCKCNKCECESYNGNETFYGEFCQCNNFACPRTGGKLCSGLGECVCGKCQCFPGWINEACSCENSTTNCIPPNGNEADTCSGHGQCICNKCQCDQAGGYSGKYCNKCPTCNTKCNELKDCVQCKVHQSGPLTQEQCDKCSYNITEIDYLKVTDEDYFCSAYDDQDCRFTYIYEVIGSQVNVLAQKNKECPPQARIPGVVFSVILSIVLIGLAFLLMWKFITSMRDRREFAKFEKERMMAKWDAGQNPIYKQATSTFKNPTYCGS